MKMIATARIGPRRRWHSASSAEGMHRPGPGVQHTPTTITTSTTSRTAGRGARRGLIVLALALGALLLPLSAPVAHAEPPEVTTKDNPVLIDFGETTKEIKLEWSLVPGTLAANLVVTPTPLPAPVVSCIPSCEGTKDLTVALGTTYTAQLKDAVTNQPLGALLTITTEKRPKPDFDFGCMVQCITKDNVTPHGGWAQFTIETSETAMMTLEASETKPNPDGTWSNPADVAASTATILPTQNWTPQLPDLKSNTTYYYVVRAHANGHGQVKTGSVHTLTRRVEVTFAEIQMIDDSDGFGAGDCDCSFMFNAHDAKPKNYGEWNADEKSIASGTTVHPNVQVSVADAWPNKIWIRAFGTDDDTDFGELCSAGLPNPEGTWDANWKDSGESQECLEWAGDQVHVSVSRQGPDTKPSEVDEEFTESFTISVSGELVYKVRGTYKVTYV